MRAVRHSTVPLFLVKVAAFPHGDTATVSQVASIEAAAPVRQSSIGG
jgi:hypothetical protein